MLLKFRAELLSLVSSSQISEEFAAEGQQRREAGETMQTVTQGK